ncbi:hypothetical protein Tco_1044200 [Tanacetum coccineum]|uniref:Uncharacterized protein n=1 Tax=Tanacetum coccineum TaxID=301880 RepID=A0ABQ5GQF9_9ASTR
MLHPPLLKGASSRCSIPQSCLLITREKMREFLLKKSSHQPEYSGPRLEIHRTLTIGNFDSALAASLCGPYFYWFLDKVAILVKLDLFKKDNQVIIR